MINWYAARDNEWVGKHVRTASELETALSEQRGFLRASSAAYDAGTRAEAKRLANTVYILVHEGTGRTKSLLGQMGLRDSLEITTTATPLDRYPRVALAFMHCQWGKWEFVPRFVDREIPASSRIVSLSEWWEEPIFQSLDKPSLVVRMNHKGKTLSRKNLVFHLRSQDGGAHFDSEIEREEYADIAIRAAVGFEGTDGQGNYRPVPFAHLASMRQIAWELEQALMQVPGGPDVPPPPAWPPRVDRPANLSRSVMEYGSRLRFGVRLTEPGEIVLTQRYYGPPNPKAED